MKLMIQIPCYNEELTLPQTFSDLPKHIDGIDKIETQIIDDGSSDRTIDVAKKLGINHIIKLNTNKGLGFAFKAGVENALKNSSDILVNTDGDNQYKGNYIKDLVKPIIEKKANLVIGCRPIKDHQEFSFVKKILQLVGSYVVRKLSNTEIKDVSSGFRAYSREALFNLNIYSNFSYCLESLIQLGLKNMGVTGIDIEVNKKTRKSRLFNSVFIYIFKQLKIIINVFLVYRSNYVFNFLAFTSFLISILLLFRYFYLTMFFEALAGSFWPSLVFAFSIFSLSIILYFFGILASLNTANRILLEELLYISKKNKY